ncbi:transposase [Spirosoma lacussanchae]
MRALFNTLLYVTKTGGQWRQTPNNLPPWPLCYCYFGNRSAEAMA